MEQNKYIEKVRDNYSPHGQTKLDELRALDKKAKLFPTVFAYVFGAVSALILGVGMCLAMEVIGTSVMSSTVLMVLGVIIGCVGIALCVANFYIYKAILQSCKKKYGSQIIALSNELLNQ